MRPFNYLINRTHRMSPQNRDTVDLHGTSVAEATVIIREILSEERCSSGTSSPHAVVPGID